MTLEQLYEINILANDIKASRKRVEDLLCLRSAVDVFGDGIEYIKAEVAGIEATLDVKHFKKFLDVEVMRAEDRVDSLDKQLESM